MRKSTLVYLVIYLLFLFAAARTFRPVDVECGRVVPCGTDTECQELNPGIDY